MAGNGLPYFPLMCQLDEKFELLEAEYGLKGFAVVIKLFQRIYGEHGYYCDWTNEVELLFSRRIGLPVGDNSVSEIVQSAIKRGIFSRDKYEEYNILTSKGIQERYFSAAKRKKKIEVKKDYLLISYTHFSENVHIIEENVNKNLKNTYNSEQSKVKESRVKKSKVKESKEECMPGAEASGPTGDVYISLTLNDNSGHPIYGRQVEEWEKLYPAVDVEQELRKMKGWLDANPTRRKTSRGIMRFVTNWLAREQDSGGSKRIQTQQTKQSNGSNPYLDLLREEMERET